MKCRKKFKGLITPSRNLKLKAFPRSFGWRISASFEGLDTLLKIMDLELRDKYYVSYFSYPTSCLDSLLVFHRDFVERLEAFTFESVGNIIEHRLLKLAKSQVYEHKLTYRQRIYSTQMLSVELILTPCRMKLVVSYPARAFYFASLKAKRHFQGYLEYLQNLSGLNNDRGLRISKNSRIDRGYGESIMRYSFRFLQRHRVLSASECFSLR